jgi:hypothetical protein
MNAELEAILEAVTAELDFKAENVARFMREEDDHTDTFAALSLALAITPPSDVLDLAFAGIVYLAKVKLAAAEKIAEDV